MLTKKCESVRFLNVAKLEIIQSLMKNLTNQELKLQTLTDYKPTIIISKLFSIYISTLCALSGSVVNLCRTKLVISAKVV